MKNVKGGCRGMHKATTQLLKITMCEESVYFLRLHSPRAIEHPGPTYPPGLALHFSCDLHLIPSTRTALGLTPWTTLSSWLEVEESSCLTSSLDPARWCSLAFFFSMSSSCLNVTFFFFLIFTDECGPDWYATFILVAGFLFFLRTPKHPQSFRDKRVNMTIGWSCYSK